MAKSHGKCSPVLSKGNVFFKPAGHRTPTLPKNGLLGLKAGQNMLSASNITKAWRKHSFDPFKLVIQAKLRHDNYRCRGRRPWQPEEAIHPKQKGLYSIRT